MQTLKLKIISVMALLILTAIFFVLTPALSLAASDPCHPENDKPPRPALPAAQVKSCEQCQSGHSPESCLQSNVIVIDINNVIKFLSAGVGVVVVATIIVGGIQYSMAGDNAEAVTKAKKRIINGLIALVVFILIFSFLQWIIPGGIFNTKTP